MRLYIAGPMSGIEDFNFAAFASAAEYLRGRGYTVISPAEADEEDGGVVDGKATMSWADYMRRDIQLILDVEGIATLPGWAGSRGARLETHIARELGLPHYQLVADDRTGGWNMVLMQDGDQRVHTIPSVGVAVSDL